MKTLRCFALILFSIIVSISCTGQTSDTAATASSEEHRHDTLESYYTCSMHPKIKSEKPGKCPICYMNLTKVEVEKSPLIEAVKSLQPEASIVLYQCADYPDVTSEISELCPLDGTPMIPKPKQELTTSEIVAQIKLKKSQMSHFKPHFFPLTRMKMIKPVRLLGSVVAAEENESTIPARVAGRVEEVKIASTGSLIKKGDPVVSLYSPRLIAAGEEYILAHKAYRRNNSHSTRSLVARSKERLELWGIKKEQYSSWIKQGSVPRKITIHSTVNGIVQERNAKVGKYFKEGENFFRLTDLSSVWVELDVYEQDVTLVKIGQLVSLNFIALPGQPYESKIDFISPTLNTESRTLKIRTTIANPDGVLRPGMAADSRLEIEMDGLPLIVPRNAVIDTGTRKVVWVKKGPQSFFAKTIQTGHEAQGYIEVLSGLTEEDSVVTEGNFLLDAQAQLFGGYTNFNPINPHAGHEM